MKALVERVRSQDQRALARAISFVENDHPDKLSMLSDFAKTGHRAHYIGITGSPGAGKSSLVDRIITAVRQAGKTIAVIAVDPTSPFSGGALLGDRFRMHKHFSDPDVFIRSMATRGSLGGLARSTKDAVRVCNAYGFDYVLVETVGVGQSELDIMKVADTTAVVLTPNSGDVLQIFKAGIMEIADLFVINKADLPGVQKLKTQLSEFMHIVHHEHWVPPILETISTENKGIDELLHKVEQHHRFLQQTEAGRNKQTRQLTFEIYDIIREQIWLDVKKFIEADDEKQNTLKAGKNPYTIAKEWLRDWKRERG
ncbi:methylmalonyl Co-A mutase-associated GTPase MeaB [Salirhabdus salicampi]|uniref:methylmalonyl Co-A mutase-associated GTPase MeaB n=1 Tax=Salirhabdus salicampi TaxID=476102 RepID=UPI0020C45876|nr:methylmalonyl Co-A mutase-associated GTPase MeaB [Salirhabdus salicampi]MCP8617406.1 methylmalonyl Co-A mutase-associated GTPase MeaB [Salirhabdus salicampi]